MQKTLEEMAVFMQKLLPPIIPQTFEIDAMFHGISSEEGIRKGVHAFRDFMYHLFNRLIANGKPFDKPKKETHEFSDNTNIPTSYPFVSNIAVFLTNIGVHGNLSNSRDTMMLNSLESFTAENNVSNTKIPDTRKIECLRFLSDCGIRFDGLDLSKKKPALSSFEPIIISYPESPDMLTGLKCIATAQRDMSTRFMQDILLRCDYRVLANKNVEILPLLRDLTCPLPADIQDFMLKFHQNYMSHGYKCDTYIGSSIRFEYFCRSKELWRFNLSLNNGHNITVKALNADKYPDTIKLLPKWLQDKIAKGYGCGKKMGVTTSCDGGCRGFRIPLNDSFMEISHVIKAWIEREVMYIQNKK